MLLKSYGLHMVVGTSLKLCGRGWVSGTEEIMGFDRQGQA